MEPLSEIEFELIWGIYAKFLEKLVKENKEEPISFEELYRTVYRVTVAKRGADFFLRVLNFVESHPQRKRFARDENVQAVRDTFMYFGKVHKIDVPTIVRFVAFG